MGTYDDGQMALLDSFFTITLFMDVESGEVKLAWKAQLVGTCSSPPSKTDGPSACDQCKREWYDDSRQSVSPSSRSLGSSGGRVLVPTVSAARVAAKSTTSGSTDGQGQCDLLIHHVSCIAC